MQSGGVSKYLLFISEAETWRRADDFMAEGQERTGRAEGCMRKRKRRIGYAVGACDDARATG